MDAHVGSVIAVPALDRPDLLAEPVRAALAEWGLSSTVGVVEIDPDLADTAAFCERYAVAPSECANCVVVCSRREGSLHFAACVVLASTKADVNGLVRRHLGQRKVSFAPMDAAVSESGMQHGGITPVGLPPNWPILIDEAVTSRALVVMGSGRRTSKLVVPGHLVSSLPKVEVLRDLGR